jgi:hypothetical protein
MPNAPFYFRVVLACCFLLGGQHLGAQSIQLQAEITQFRSNYTEADYRGPDITWKWTGSVSVDGISRALTPGCLFKDDLPDDPQTFNETRSLINEVFALPSANGTQGALDLDEDIIFRINLKNWEDDRGSSCDYDTNGGVLQNDDDGYREVNWTYAMNVNDAGTWRSFPFEQGTYGYGYTIRFRYVLVDLISSLTSNAANVICEQSTVRLTANRNAGFTGGRYLFQRKFNGGDWFNASRYQSQNYIDVPASNLTNSSYRVSSSSGLSLGDNDFYKEFNPSGITIVPSFAGSIPLTTQGACAGSTGGSITYTGRELGAGVRVRLSLDRRNSEGNYGTAAPPVELDDAAAYTFAGLTTGIYRINASALAPGDGGIIANCTSSQSNISIPEISQPLIISAVANSPSCNAGGSVFVSANANGSGNLQFFLKDAVSDATVQQSGGFSTATSFRFSGVNPGTYTVRIAATNGCFNTSLPLTIGDVPAPASGTVTVLSQEASFDISCPGSTVPVQVTAPTGQGSYRVRRIPGYEVLTLSPGSSGFFTSRAGTFTYVFTRLNSGCNFRKTRTITENPTPVSVAISDPVAPTACMAAAGSLTATMANGTGPYTFQITPGPAAITQANPVYIFPMLTGGNYIIDVSDSRGCTAQSSTFLAPPTGISIGLTLVDITCTGGDDGSITLSGSGGTPPLEYKIVEINDNYGTQTVFPGLSAGTYTAAVRDADSCEEMRDIIVSEPDPLVITMLTSDSIFCRGNQTYLRATVTGREFCDDAMDGAPGALGFLTYSTDGGTSFQSLTEYELDSPCANEITLLLTVSAGDYDVQVQDYRGCPSNILSFGQADFEEPTELILNLDEVTSSTCFSANDGTITVSYSGGIPNYVIRLYERQPDGIQYPVQTSPVLTESSGTYTFGNLPVSSSAFSYVVFINDNKSLTDNFLIDGACRVELDPIIVPQPDQLEILEVIQTGPDVNCDGSGGEITVTSVTGGTPPYQYSLLFDGGFADATVLNPEIRAGNVYVQDANGCVFNGFYFQDFAIPDLNIVPVIVQPIGCQPGQITATISGGDGPYTVELLLNGVDTDALQTETSNGEPIVFDALNPNSYVIGVIDVFGCWASADALMESLPELSMTTTAKTDENCFAAQDGSITVQVSGGVPPYTILYNGTPSTGPTRTLTNLVADYYTFIVIDDFGCDLVYTDSLELLNDLRLNAVVTSPSPCLESTSGTLTVTPSGGAPPYDIVWLTDEALNTTLSGGQSATFNNLAAIEYTIQITDANGCSQFLDSYMEGPDSITVEVINLVQPDCDQTGSFDLDIEGGTAPFQISLNGAPAVTNTSFSALPDGDYLFAVTDANGCELLTTDVSVSIQTASSITASAVAVGVSCPGFNDGSITINTVGAGAGAMFSLNGGAPQASNVFNNLLAGTYSVDVVSAGCNTTVTDIVVTEPSEVVITPIVVMDDCTGQASFTLTASGGSGSGYTYTIDATAVDPTVPFIGEPGGVYEVQVMDGNGCADVDNVIVPPFTPLTITNTIVTDARCDDGTGEAAVEITGGTGVYTFAWSNGGPADSLFTNAVAGDYTVSITDALGCLRVSPTITIGLVEGVSATVVTVDANCGAADGSITVNASGGSGTYGYNWEAGVTAVDNQATGLIAGNYAYTLTDLVTNCTTEASASIGGIDGASISLVDQTIAGCGSFALASATITASDGVPPYSFRWSSGATDPTANDLVAGSNFVTVTDNDGCERILEVVIEQSPSPNLALTNQTEAGCNANNLATATAAGSGGTGNLTYAWSNGQSGATATGLIAGDYTVTVTDDLGCTDEITVNILQASDPILQLESQTEAGCGAQNFASSTISASGGRAPYSFLWSNGETEANATNLPVGDNTVTVTDVLGCTDALTVNIAQAPSPTITLESQTAAGCTTAALATATVSATGGTGGLSYAWSSGDNTPTVDGLAAGDYTITVTDALDCTDEITISITQAPNPVISISTQTAADCGPGGVASATAEASGGTAAYTFAWSNGETTATALNLPPGTSTVTVTDAQGCTDETTVTIDQIAVPTVTVEDVDCFGNNNGQITVSAPGLATGAMYNIDIDDPQTSLIFNDLEASTYSITINASNCMATITDIVVNAPNLLALDAVITSDPCTGFADILLTGTGGTPPYTFSFDGGTFVTENEFVGDPGIAYPIAIMDGNGCIITSTATVPGFTPLTISFSEIVEAACEDGTGEAAVAVIGGTPPYSFAWSDGSTDSLLVGADAGAYTLEVSDVNSCIVASELLTINLINVIMATATPIDASCGLADGSISLSVTGGSGNYVYTWEAGVTATENTATNLAAGTYSFTVSDTDTGCTTTGQVPVQGEGGPTLSIENQTEAGCVPGTFATATVSTTNGLPPFTYAWSNGSSGTTGTNLESGANTVSVTDANGCLGILQVEIIRTPSPELTLVSQTLAGCTTLATATVSAQGGELPYIYDWSNGEIEATATSLSAGINTVTVTDAFGCTDVLAVTIEQSFPPLVRLISQTVAGCENEASATVAGSFGTPPYTYLWSNAETTATAVNLQAGDNTITLTDSLGCIDQFTFTIEQTDTLLVSLTGQTLAGCGDQSFASATVLIEGGLTPYTYLWSSGETEQTADQLPAGTNTLTVTDALGCSEELSFAVDRVDTPVIMLQDQTEAGCGPIDFGGATVLVNGGTGPYQILWSSGDTGQAATQLLAGSNTVTVTDAGHCTAVLEVIILTTASPALQLVSQTTVGCSPGARASATIAASGGTPPYAFSWSTGSNGAITDDLLPGLNTVTVTDGNNCTAELDVTIEQARTPTLSLVTQSTIGCAITSTATASIMADGGTPPFTYLWSSGETGPTAINLPLGLNSVTVTDVNTCLAQLSVTILQAEPPELTLESQTVAGCGTQNAAGAVVSALNGAPPYDFSWSSGESGPSATNLSAGANTVTVTDANGCSDELVVMIEQAASPTLAISSLTDANCAEGTGAIAVLVTGGTGTISYEWSHDAQLDAPSATDLFSGEYGVTITDGLGCNSSLTGLTVEYNAPPVLNLEGTTPSTCTANSGTITLSVSGGTEPLNYTWTNDVSTGLNGENLIPGDYVILVTDANGCTDVVMATVEGESSLGLTVTSFTDASCGKANGRITVSQENGSAPFDYDWSHDVGLAGPVATGLLAGSYSVLITDTNGCTAQVSKAIGDSPAVIIDGETISPADCGQEIGSIAVTVSGGTGNLTYTWNHNDQADGPTVTGLSAGVYAVTITDELGCDATASYTVDNTEGPIIFSSEAVDALCTDGTGSISVAVTNGSEPYTYSWTHNTELNANTAINLSAGNYVVIVTDASGCTVEGNFSIDFQPAPALMLSPMTPACGAPNTGSISAILIGGQAPFSYSWSTTSTNPFLENIPAGDYGLTVTDDNGCAISATTTVEARPVPMITLEYTQNIACPEVLGSASFLVSNLGGTASFTFSDPGIDLVETDVGGGNTRVVAEGLSTGTYSLEVVNELGCSAITSATITTLPPFQLVVIEINPASCNGEDSGSAAVEIVGSTEDFSFQWDTAAANQTGPVANDLAAGSYRVTASSSSGCEETVTVVIEAPDPITLSTTSAINPGCFAGETGSITVMAAGGTVPYSFAWRGDTLPAFPAQTDLPAGEYLVTLTDANGCQESLEITLSQPDAIVPNLTVVNSDCAGSSSGSITLAPSGGTAPYSYFWPDFPGETGNSVIDIVAGNYSVTVTDAVGCQVTAAATVEEDNGTITLTVIEQVEVSCPEVADGSVTVLAAGDNGPFTYAWSSGGDQATVTGLAGGQSYAVTATNSRGCTQQLTINLSQGEPLEITGIPQDTSVCAGNIFALALTDYPGATVAGPGGFTSSDETVLLEAAGEYLITYTTASGCSARHTLNFSVTDAALTAQIVMASDITIDQRLVVLEASFPVPQSITWVFDERRVTLEEQDENLYYFSFSEPDVYSIGMVADVGGCSDAISKQVTVHADSTTIPGANLGAAEILELNVAPNPNMGVFTVSATLASAQPFSLTLYRDSGERVERRETINTAAVSEAFNLILVPGTYFLQAQVGNERRITVVIVQ